MSDHVSVPRDAVQALVDSLEGEWWVKAADALRVLREALNAPDPEPDQFKTFGSTTSDETQRGDDV